MLHDILNLAQVTVAVPAVVLTVLYLVTQTLAQQTLDTEIHCSLSSE